MGDVNKPKLLLRAGLPINGDKTPSPATKLLINHGKPNFTIQRSAKTHTQNGNVSSTTTSSTPVPTNHMQNNNNNKEFVVRSSTFNGVFKPTIVSAADKKTLPHNGNAIATSSTTQNEATKVVLRRPKYIPPEIRGDQDGENVPEFIRRQRRIQERLANQSILDFENRRSGYFTQVLISPSSPNRQSFVETMASPAVKPGLEMPPPPSMQHEDIQEETATTSEEIEHKQSKVEESIKAEEATSTALLNEQVEEEEVAKAIEEVNKAVEGEDDDKIELEENEKSSKQEIGQESTLTFATEMDNREATKTENVNTNNEIEDTATETPFAATNVTSAKAPIEQNGHTEAATKEAYQNGEKSNDFHEKHLLNGYTNGGSVTNGITICHTNGLDAPRLPTPDPKGEKGVNFEPKTVVSFSHELGNGDNKYPDTVKVVKSAEEVDDELKELTKLKFEIKANDHDIEVKPMLTTETL